MELASNPFVCPLHPNIRRFGPGTCPKCGLELEERGARNGLLRYVSNPLHIGIMLVLMLAVMAAILLMF